MSFETESRSGGGGGGGGRRGACRFDSVTPCPADAELTSFFVLNDTFRFLDSVAGSEVSLPMARFSRCSLSSVPEKTKAAPIIGREEDDDLVGRRFCCAFVRSDWRLGSHDGRGELSRTPVCDPLRAEVVATHDEAPSLVLARRTYPTERKVVISTRPSRKAARPGAGLRSWPNPAAGLLSWPKPLPVRAGDAAVPRAATQSVL
jgi:hypothetical protein